MHFPAGADDVQCSVCDFDSDFLPPSPPVPYGERRICAGVLSATATAAVSSPLLNRSAACLICSCARLAALCFRCCREVRGRFRTMQCSRSIVAASLGPATRSSIEPWSQGRWICSLAVTAEVLFLRYRYHCSGWRRCRLINVGAA